MKWTACVLFVLLTPTMAAGPGGPVFKPGSWLDGLDGYQEAKAIQEATGRDLVVYFSNNAKPDEKGLCHWFEKKGLTHDVEDFLEAYILVRIRMPLGSKEEEVLGGFRVTSAPSLFVVRTNGWNKRVSPFDWPGGKPEPKKAEKLIGELRAASGPRYQKGAEYGGAAEEP